SASGPVKLGVRPEHFRFGNDGLSGRIDQIEPMGRETLYIVDSPMGVLSVLDPSVGIHHGIGEHVNIGIEDGAPLMFDPGGGELMADARIALSGAG
ncbi:MAG: TOBE domain-containing protein, partial [Rhodospirillales bacterium]|nr:TOBE domain-containing protein [Rhodospirillales bacterium]